MIVELGHGDVGAIKVPQAHSSFHHIRAMVCESVGPVRHEVSIPFHDSQVRSAALIIQTGWDQFWGTDTYWEPGPFLAESLIFRMVRSGVKVAGVDFPVSGGSSATQLVTSGKIPIVENLRGVKSLPRIGFYFSAVPLDVSTADIRAVHAFAEIT